MQTPIPGNSKNKWILPLIAVLSLSCCCVFILAGVVFYPKVRQAISASFSTPEPVPEVDINPSAGNGSSTGPASGGLGDNLLKTDVWNSIVQAYASQKSCQDVTSTQIEVRQPPDSSGAWQEAWTVMACGQTNVLVIDFTPSADGGTDYTIHH